MKNLPENMTRVLVFDYDNIPQFAFYKDGMFLMEGYTDNWKSSSEFKKFVTIKELKNICDI